MPGWLENLRKWIDGEDDADRGRPRTPSKWEDFLVAIAREVDRTMLQEMFTPPGGPTYIPREYIVFLSPADDADWQGEKREGLQRGLHHVLSERAKELVGDKEFQTKTFTVELRVDGTLAAGHFKVQPIWDVSSPATTVKPRAAALENRGTQLPPAALAQPSQSAGKDPVVSAAPAAHPADIGAAVPDGAADHMGAIGQVGEDAPPSSEPAPGSAAESQATAGLGSEPGADPSEATTSPLPAPAQADSDDQATIVRPRSQKLAAIRISVRRLGQSNGDEADDVRLFYKDEITIGRGSGQVSVDLELKGDLEVSRKHATLARRPGGEFQITCHGANPMLVEVTGAAVDSGAGPREVETGQTVPLKPGTSVRISSYELRILGT